MSAAAVIIGASGGIGAALERAMIEEGRFVAVHGLARSRGGDQHIDLLDEASIAAAAARLASGPPPALVIVATGLLHEGARQPEKSVRELDPEWLAHSLAVNAIGPALIAKHFLPLMPRDRGWTFAALSARVGSISDNRLGGWHGYRAAKAALNMLIRNIAIEARRSNERAVVVALHPGTVDSAMSRPFQGNVPPAQLFDADRAALQLLDVIDGLKPHDSGKLIAWDGTAIPF